MQKSKSKYQIRYTKYILATLLAVLVLERVLLTTQNCIKFFVYRFQIFFRKLAQFISDQALTKRNYLTKPNYRRLWQAASSLFYLVQKIFICIWFRRNLGGYGTQNNIFVRTVEFARRNNKSWSFF